MTRAAVLALALAAVTTSAADAQPAQTVFEFESGGVSVHYQVQGAGSPVILIHGFTGSAPRHFGRTGVADALEQAGYRVIAMDCRGHGQSGKPLDPAQYGMEMVRDVVRLMDHLKIDRAHVVGYSMGGGIAQQLLVKYPARLLTVALLGSGWEGENMEALTAQMAAMADGFDKRDASGLIRGVQAGAQSGPSDAAVAAAAADLFSRNDPKVLAAIARALPSLWQVSRDELRAVQVPVLAINGEFEPSNVEAANRMVGLVPRLELVELPGTNHATSVRPAATHIVEFLNRTRCNETPQASPRRPPACW